MNCTRCVGGFYADTTGKPYPTLCCSAVCTSLLVTYKRWRDRLCCPDPQERTKPDSRCIGLLLVCATIESGGWLIFQTATTAFRDNAASRTFFDPRPPISLSALTYIPHGNCRLGRVHRVPRRAAFVQRTRHVPCLHYQHVVPPWAERRGVQRDGPLLPRRVHLRVSHVHGGPSLFGSTVCLSW